MKSEFQDEDILNTTIYMYVYIYIFLEIKLISVFFSKLYDYIYILIAI